MADLKPWEKFQSGSGSSSGNAGTSSPVVNGPWSKFQSGTTGVNGGSNVVGNTGAGVSQPAQSGVPDSNRVPLAVRKNSTAAGGDVGSVAGQIAAGEDVKPFRQSFFQPGINTLTGMLNQLKGGVQGTSGNPAQYGPPLGKLEYDDADKPIVGTGKGSYRDVDPKTDIVLIDPQTQQPMVYSRTKDTERGKLASAGNIITPFVTTTSPVGVPRQMTQRAQDVNRLMDAGVTPTIGQIKGGLINQAEQKLISVPVAGDIISGARTRALEGLNSATYNEVLAPIGARITQAPGRGAVAEVERTISDGYNRVLNQSGVTLRPDVQLQNDLRAIGITANEGRLGAENVRYMRQFMDDLFLREWNAQGGGYRMTGPRFKQVESELSQEISRIRSAPSSTFRDLNMANDMDDVLTAMRSSLERSNPNYAPQLQALNRSWANWVRLRKAAGGIGARDGVFKPSQLQAAVRAADKSRDKGAFARGQATMQDLSEPAIRVLGDTVPDSGTAGRNMLGEIVRHPITGATGLAATVPALGLYSEPMQWILAQLLRQNPMRYTSALPGQLANFVHNLPPVHEAKKKRWGQE